MSSKPIPFGLNALAPPSADNAMGSLQSFHTVMQPFHQPPAAPALLGFPPFEPELSANDAKHVAWFAIARHPLDSVAYDRFGNELHWSEHGNQDSPYGWHVDHHPRAKMLGGRLIRGNVEALHWRANTTIGGVLGSLK